MMLMHMGPGVRMENLSSRFGIKHLSFDEMVLSLTLNTPVQTRKTAAATITTNAT